MWVTKKHSEHEVLKTVRKIYKKSGIKIGVLSKINEVSHNFLFKWQIFTNVVH